MSRKTYNYKKTEEDVCAICFKKPDECNCQLHTKKVFVPIDKGMQEILQILNDKGYRTMFCCESHTKYGEIYIKFCSVFDFDIIVNNVPQGFKITKSTKIIRYTYNTKITDAEFEEQKEKQLGILLNWAKDLPKTKDADLLKRTILNQRM